MKKNSGRLGSTSNGAKKLKPVVRAMILADVVFVAAVQMLSDGAVITPAVGTGATIFGLIVMVVALVIQFREPGEHRQGEKGKKNPK